MGCSPNCPRPVSVFTPCLFQILEYVIFPFVLDLIWQNLCTVFWLLLRKPFHASIPQCVEGAAISSTTVSPHTRRGNKNFDSYSLNYKIQVTIAETAGAGKGRERQVKGTG